TTFPRLRLERSVSFSCKRISFLESDSRRSARTRCSLPRLRCSCPSANQLENRKTSVKPTSYGKLCWRKDLPWRIPLPALGAKPLPDNRRPMRQSGPSRHSSNRHDDHARDEYTKTLFGRHTVMEALKSETDFEKIFLLQSAQSSDSL